LREVRKVKAKIICILVMTLLIFTALPALGTMNQKEKPIDLRSNNLTENSQANAREVIVTDRGGMFFQLPYLPNEAALEYASESTRQIIEDFWEITSPICDVHWWGEYVLYEGGEWFPLDPDIMKVNIIFYEDNNGQPGNVVASYIDVKPTVYPSGLWYDWGDPDLWQLYYFEYVLDPCVSISEGWVSISNVDIGDNGWLMLITSPDGNSNFLRNESGTMASYPYDVALVLTDGEQSNPDLECDGELNWIDVPAGGTVTGDFVVRNNGEPGSILHWKIESYPNWGEWTFSNNASVLTIDDGWFTVDVVVVAPGEINSEFIDKLTLINVMDPSETCIINVKLITPRNKEINNPFLHWLQGHTNMFPLLQKLIQLGFGL
jgi:hypothetical protein